VALNLWFEHVIDAYLRARAEGRDWREAGPPPRPYAARKKGLTYTRQHLAKKVKGGAFPKPFQPDSNWARSPAELKGGAGSRERG